MNSSIPAQVGGTKREVIPLDDADKRKEKMTDVVVVIKNFMRKRGRRSKMNNRDSEEE